MNRWSHSTLTPRAVLWALALLIGVVALIALGWGIGAMGQHIGLSSGQDLALIITMYTLLAAGLIAALRHK